MTFEIFVYTRPAFLCLLSSPKDYELTQFSAFCGQACQSSQPRSVDSAVDLILDCVMCSVLVWCKVIWRKDKKKSRIRWVKWKVVSLSIILRFVKVSNRVSYVCTLIMLDNWCCLRFQTTYVVPLLTYVISKVWLKNSRKTLVHTSFW